MQIWYNGNVLEGVQSWRVKLNTEFSTPKFFAQVETERSSYDKDTQSYAYAYSRKKIGGHVPIGNRAKKTK